METLCLTKMLCLMQMPSLRLCSSMLRNHCISRRSIDQEAKGLHDIQPYPASLHAVLYDDRAAAWSPGGQRSEWIRDSNSAASLQQRVFWSAAYDPEVSV